MKTLLTLSSEQGIDIIIEKYISAVKVAEKPIVSLICLYVYKYTCYGLLSVIFEKFIYAVKVAEKPIVDIVLALYL